MSNHSLTRLITAMSCAGHVSIHRADDRYTVTLTVGDDVLGASAFDVNGAALACYKQCQAAEIVRDECPRGKMQIPTEAEADRIAAEVTRKNLLYHTRAEGRLACRSYLCPDCNQWHVTSIPATR